MAKFVWKPVGFCAALQGHYCVGGFFGEGTSWRSSEIRFWKLVKKVGGKKKIERWEGKKTNKNEANPERSDLTVFFFPLVKLPNEADVAMQ